MARVYKVMNPGNDSLFTLLQPLVLKKMNGNMLGTKVNKLNCKSCSSVAREDWSARVITIEGHLNPLKPQWINSLRPISNK